MLILQLPQTKQTPLAHLKTPLSVIVQVLSALTEGVGINAATRLYGVSKNSIYHWQERLRALVPFNVQRVARLHADLPHANPGAAG